MGAEWLLGELSLAASVPRLQPSGKTRASRIRRIDISDSFAARNALYVLASASICRFQYLSRFGMSHPTDLVKPPKLSPSMLTDQVTHITGRNVAECPSRDNGTNIPPPCAKQSSTYHTPNTKGRTGEIVSLVRDAGLRDNTELACESGGCLVVITVAAPIAEDERAAIDHVEWWERLSDGGDRVVYLFKISFSGFDEDVRPMLTSDVPGDEIRVDDNGINVALVGSQEAIAREISEYDDAGMTVLLERVADYDGPRTTLDALSDCQREILRTAYEYWVFRRATDRLDG